MPEQESKRGNQVTVAPFEAPFENQVVRFGLQGLNLKDSLDAMEGWSRLTNVDQEDEGEATGRQGQTVLATMAGVNHSIRKMRLPASGTSPGAGIPTIPNYSAMVATVAARYNRTIPIADREAGKSQLTRAIAWEIYQTDPSIGLLFKNYGNQVLTLSTDIVVQTPSGDYADVATDTDNGNGTVTITGTWFPHTSTDLAARWVEPTAALVTTPPVPMSLV